MTSEQWKQLDYYRQECLKDKRLKGLLNQNGTVQESIFKRDEQTNLLIKCRLDLRIENIGIDIKSSQTSDPEWFNKQAKRLGYAIQDAMCSDIADLEEFHFITIENQMPFTLTFDSEFDDEMKQLGFLQYRYGLLTIDKCLKTNNWQPYTTNINIIKANQFDRGKIEYYQNAINDMENNFYA